MQPLNSNVIFVFFQHHLGFKIVLQIAAIYQLCQLMPVDARNSAGTSRAKAVTSRDKAGTNRVKQGKTRTVPFCPCLSLIVPVGPCRS